MGVAASHDIQDGILNPGAPDFEEEYWFKRRTRQKFRVKVSSWWPEELPSDAEYLTAMETLENTGWKADYVISHCAPTGIARKVNAVYRPDTLTDFLELLNQRLDLHYWLFGHYHDNRNVTREHILP